MADNLNYGRVKTDTGSGGVAVGTIVPWTKAVAPNGYLKCDGSAVSRATYADLFNVIGTTYGVGDGSTTFNLPELTSRTLVGANTSTNVGQTGGAHDTTGAGFSLQNNLSSQNSQNLATQTTNNLALQTTDNLAIQNAQNLAGQSASNISINTTQNLAFSASQNLSGSVTGNIADHTLTLSQIPSHNHPGASLNPTSGIITGSRPSGGAGGGFGQSGSDQAHGHTHTFAGSITGNVTGNLTGNVTGNVAGDVTTNVTGTADATLTGSATPNLTGDVNTALTGNAGVNLTGNVTIQNASLYSQHLVVIYIIKH